jgi:hypothetical protein
MVFEAWAWIVQAPSSWVYAPSFPSGPTSSPSGFALSALGSSAGASPASPPSSSAPIAAAVATAAAAALVARAAVPRVATTGADAIAAALAERAAAGSSVAASAGAVWPAKATVPASVNGAVAGVATSMPWLGAAPAAAGVPAAVLASVTLGALFTTPRDLLPPLRSAAAAPASADGSRKDFEAFASPDRGLASERAFPRPASAAPPGDALLPVVCALRFSAAAGARRAVVPGVFLPLPSAAAELALPRPGAFAALRCALTRSSAPPPVPLVLEEAVPPRGLVVPAAFLRTGAFLVPVLVGALPAGFRAPAGVARALPVALFLAADPTRFVVAFEARVPAAFLRAGALVVLAPVGDALTAFRDRAGAERVLPAAFFVADPTRFLGAFAVRAPAILVRRPEPEVAWAVTLPVALLAPDLDRIGLLAAALEPLPEGVRLAGLRGFSSAGVFAIWSPHLLEVAVPATLSVSRRSHAAQRRATRQMSNCTPHRASVLPEDLTSLHFCGAPGRPVGSRHEGGLQDRAVRRPQIQPEHM